MNRPNYVFFIIMLFLFVWGGGRGNHREAAAEEKTVHIGVLARRGEAECLREWSSTAQYLSDQMPGTFFKIVPLAFEEVMPAVKKETVEFLVVNSSIYVEMQTLYGVNRMATIKRITAGGYSTLIGGVLLCRSDRPEIAEFKDLKGKSFMAVDETSFGGWRAAWRELKAQGINPHADFSRLLFGGTHDAVIYAVRDGKVDAGTVSTPILEQMIAEGKITQDALKVIHRQTLSDFPYACSTRVYPEWPFAKLKNTPDALAEKVAIALLGMPAQSPAAKAAGCAGWTVPLDYGSVEACLKDLRVGIYKDFGKITLSILFSAYRWQLVSGAAVTVIFIWFLFHSLQLNWTLKLSEQRLQEEMAERRRTEEALRESEKMHRTLFQEMLEGFALHEIVCDKAGNPVDYRFLAVNPAFERMTGIKAKDVTGRTVLEVLPGTERHWIETYGKVALTGEPAFFENFSVELKKHFEVTAFRPAAHQFACIFTDVTKRKSSEEALLESVARFKALFNATSDSVILMEPDGRILDLNETAAARRYVNTGTMIGKNILDYLPAEAATFRSSAIARILAERKLLQYEELRDGKYYSLRLFPVIDQRGKVFQLASFSRDITERKQMEQKLQQAQRMEAIGALAGGIAHDFNNILFPIIGMTGMLMEETPAASTEHENLGVIFKAARRAVDLVKQILSFSRQVEHEKMPVRVQHVLKEVLRLTRATIPSSIEITHSFQSDCGLVMADPTQLHQIVMNLVTNAYHAVEKSGGCIRLELKESVLTGREWIGAMLGAGKYAVLTISDTGHGIDPAVMGKIFEPYFTTKEVGKGTGLGLSVVHGIVKDHDGDIRVYSEPGKGTTFTVYLPVLQKVAEAASPEKPIIYETGTERILLVDDEEAIVHLEQMMLEKLGYQVTARTSSIDALAAFKARPNAFDLVITDMTMPNMTGDKLAGELGSVKPGIPVILCTGFSSQIDEKSARAMGIKGFLLKPVVKSEMAEMVRRVLDAAQNRVQ